VLEPFLDKSPYANHGQRVVEGQRLTQAASDIMLGWLKIPGVQDGVTRDFYVRQLWDAKGSAEVETMTPRTLAVYGEICGWSLAKAHARSGDAIAIASYLGNGDVFDRALASFAETYADQNERDYARLTAAAKSGDIEVETGV
jgi:predicted alpha/beta hydrolase